MRPTSSRLCPPPLALAGEWATAAMVALGLFAALLA